MYRRPKFLETLLEIRREMAAEADRDVAVFVEFIRAGERAEQHSTKQSEYSSAVSSERKTLITK